MRRKWDGVFLSSVFCPLSSEPGINPVRFDLYSLLFGFEGSLDFDLCVKKKSGSVERGRAEKKGRVKGRLFFSVLCLPCSVL